MVYHVAQNSNIVICSLSWHQGKDKRYLLVTITAFKEYMDCPQLSKRSTKRFEGAIEVPFLGTSQERQQGGRVKDRIGGLTVGHVQEWLPVGCEHSRIWGWWVILPMLVGHTNEG